MPEGKDYVQPYSYATENSAKRNEYMQPYSYIQQLYLDLSDMDEVSVRQYRGKVENSFYFSIY